MKKYVVIGFIVVAFVLYMVYHNNSNVTASFLSNRNNGSGTTASNVGTGLQGTYKDGTYTGSSADAFYGTIQVQATVHNGKLTNVQFLQSPNDRSTSIAINQQADPMLAQEAIQVQSANVAIVSGATDSSQAFMQSLADALSQAK